VHALDELPDICDREPRATLVCLWLLFVPTRAGQVVLACVEATCNDFTAVDDAANCHKIFKAAAAAGLPPVACYGADAAAPHAAFSRGIVRAWTLSELQSLRSTVAER
jgi:hypothetical protein